MTDYEEQRMLDDLIEENTEIVERLHSQLVSGNDKNNSNISILRQKVEL